MAAGPTRAQRPSTQSQSRTRSVLRRLCFVSVPIKGQKRDTLHLIEEDLADAIGGHSLAPGFRLRCQPPSGLLGIVSEKRVPRPSVV